MGRLVDIFEPLLSLMGLPRRYAFRWAMLFMGTLTAVSISAGIYWHIDLLFLAPAAVLVAWLAVVDFKALFFLLMAGIPISIEVALPGGLATDLPSEPLMWVLTLAALLWGLRHGGGVKKDFFLHPVSLLLLAHLAWTTVSVVLSQDFLVSFKYLLAKGWYVTVFYFLAGRVLSSEKDYKRMILWFSAGLAIAVGNVLIRQASRGFGFDEVNYVMGPFFRNHVMYACLLAIFLPFLWFATYWFKRWSMIWFLLAGGILALIIGINFAYTRAAYVALVAAVGMYWLINKRWLAGGLVVAIIGIGLFAGWVASRDNWLLFAPEYEKAVTHKSFDNLLEATTKLEDISVMERVYRWVAASYMIQDRPGAGFGPGNFYFFYKNYTVSSFKTYVSDNPERSGIHNYYLMVAVEQGLPGLLFFLVLCFFVILRGQRIFLSLPEKGWRRRMSAAAVLSFSLTLMLMLMNDFVETDKIGSLFFISMAMLVNLDLERLRLIAPPPPPDDNADDEQEH